MSNSCPFLLNCLKGHCHEIFASGFFHASVSPQPQSIPLEPFQTVSKIRRDIRKSRCTTGINNTSGKFATRVNDTGENFATRVACDVDTGGKFAAGVNDTDGKKWEQYQAAETLN